MSLRSACFIDKSFFLVKSKILDMGLLSLSAWLSGFPNNWTSVLRNFAVFDGK
jgi:hypothetical protein